MPLKSCRVCGKPFNASSSSERMCRECYARLDRLYINSGISEYLRKTRRFDIEEISSALNIDIHDLRLLYDMRFLERDIQTYCKIPSDYQRIADEINEMLESKAAHHELPDKPERKITSYGGEIYKRGRSQPKYYMARRKIEPINIKSIMEAIDKWHLQDAEGAGSSLTQSTTGNTAENALKG